MFNSKTNRYDGLGGFAGLPLGTDLKTENGFLQESEPLFWEPQIGVFGTGGGYTPHIGDGDYPNPKPTRPGVKPIGIPDDPPENSAPGDTDKGGGDNDSQPNPASGSDEDKTPVNDTTPETSAPQIGNDEDTDNDSNGAPEKTAEIDDGHERNTTPHHGRTDTPNTGKDKNAAPEVGNIDNTVIEPVVTSSPAEPGTIAENAISVNRDTLLEKKFFDSTSVNNPYPEKPSVMDGYEFSPSAESIAKKKAENEFLGKHMVPDGYAGDAGVKILNVNNTAQKQDENAAAQMSLGGGAIHTRWGYKSTIRNYGCVYTTQVNIANAANEYFQTGKTVDFVENNTRETFGDDQLINDEERQAFLERTTGLKVHVYRVEGNKAAVDEIRRLQTTQHKVVAIEARVRNDGHSINVNGIDEVDGKEFFNYFETAGYFENDEPYTLDNITGIRVMEFSK